VKLVFMNKRLKGPLFIIAFFLAGASLSAQDEPVYFEENPFDDGANFNDGTNFHDGTDFPELTGEPPEFTMDGEKQEEQEAPQTQETLKAPETKEKKKFRIKNRTWELSIASFGFDFSNDFIAAGDIIESPFYMLGNISDISQDPGLIWKNPIVIDLDRFFDGFRFNFGASIKPFTFNFNWKDKWGFGLDIAHIDVTGNLSLSGNMVTFSEAVQDEFGVGGAVFVEVGVPVFFHYKDFKIRIRPAAYVPVVYTEPKISYTFVETATGTLFAVNYDMRFYSLVNLDGDMDDILQNLIDNSKDIPKNNMGYDFGLNIEYPWFYNLDIGLDLVNIPVPFATAKLNHYMQLSGSVWMDTSNLNITDLIVEDEEGNTQSFDDLRGTVYDYPDDIEPEFKYDADGKKIYRPFAMVLYAHYRPFDSRFLTLIPSFGFSINYLYTKIAAVEGGLSARFDLANMFITTLGVNYNDRKWKNSLDFTMNLRAVEFNMGISLQSQDFARSWQGAGLGVNLGMKFGW